MKKIEFKMLIMKKGITQLALAKKLGVHPTLISMQVGNHKLLPKKHMEGFCEFLGLKQSDVIKNFKEN